MTPRSWLGLAVLVVVVSGAASAWREHQAQAWGPVLAGHARAGDIVMLSSTTCGFCTRAREWMTIQRVPFTECFIETDAACTKRYFATGAGGTPTLLVRGQVQLGFSAPAVAQALGASL
jgi:glutaredoxin